MKTWPFADAPETVSVTSTDITTKKLPILYASHERDEDGDIVWQFHHAIDQFDFEQAQLVRLDTILSLDPTVGLLSDLPVGWNATRTSMNQAWIRNEE